MPPIDAWPDKWSGFNIAPPSAQGVRQALNAEIVTNQRDRQSIAGLIRVIGSPEFQAGLQRIPGITPQQVTIIGGFKKMSGMDSETETPR